MPEPRAVPGSNVVEFIITDGGREVAARITREALEDHFGAELSPETWVRAYLANAPRLHRAVEGLLQGGVLQPVVVRKSHF